MKEDDKSNIKSINEKQMIGGCCVCADDSGYCDNPLVYCDGIGCNVAVHQACYGIVTVPEGPWFCRRCEFSDKNTSIVCSLCPSKEGAMKRTDNGGWAHVICALYIPEITFTNVRTMEPIVTLNIRNERFNKKCFICETNKSKYPDNGVCVNCSKNGCKLWFHVTCAQTNGLLCEDHSLPGNNVKYCIYCKNHHSKLNSEHIKIVPPFKMIGSSKHTNDDNIDNNMSVSSVSSNNSGSVTGSGENSNNGTNGDSISKNEFKNKNKKIKARLKQEDSQKPKNNKKQKLIKTENELVTDNNIINTKSILNSSLNETSNSTIKSNIENISENENEHSEINFKNYETKLPITTQMTTIVPIAQPIETVSNLVIETKMNDEQRPNEDLLKCCVDEKKVIEKPQELDLKIEMDTDTDNSKEAAAILLADLSIRQIDEVKNQSIDETIIEVVNSCVQYDHDVNLTAKNENNNDNTDNSINKIKKMTKKTIIPPTTTMTATTSSITTIEPKFKINKFKRKSCESLETTNDVDVNKLKSPKQQKPTTKRRKHINEMDPNPNLNTSNNQTGVMSSASSSLTSCIPLSSMLTPNLTPTPTTSSISLLNDTNNNNNNNNNNSNNTHLSNYLDVFGNRLNMNACLPPGLTNDYYVDEIAKQQQQQQQLQQTPPRVSQINSLLNNTTTTTTNIHKKSPIVCPPNPVINKYSILEDHTELNDTSQQQFPETLEELLLKKWQLGAEFIMEQSQHFDITSLLNCLYQLKKENKDLEGKATELSKKRDQLMLINNRLTLSLEVRSNVSNEHDTSSFDSNNDNNNNLSLLNQNQNKLLPMQSLNSIQHKNGLLFDTTKLLKNDDNLYKPTNTALPKPPQSNIHEQNTYDYTQHQIAHTKLNKIKQSKKQLEQQQQQQQQNTSNSLNSNSNSNNNIYNPNHLNTPQKQTISNLTLNDYLNSNVNDILNSQNNSKLNFNDNSQYNSNLTHSILTGTPILINTLTNNIPKIIDSSKQHNISNVLGNSGNSNNNSGQQRPASVAAINSTATTNTEIRKFEKINQLLSLQTPTNSNNQSELTQKPSAYVTPVMIKQQQQQQQQQNCLTHPSIQIPQHFFTNSKNYQQSQENLSTTLTTQPITPPLPLSLPNSMLLSTTTTTPITNATLSITSTTSSLSSSLSSSTTTTTTSTTNEMYYPSQNILLTPSLTLNYGWQNLLQHVDPSSTNSLLSLMPHFSNIDLLGLASHQQQQQHQQHQQQQQQKQQLTDHSNNPVSTSKTNSN